MRDPSPADQETMRLLLMASRTEEADQDLIATNHLPADKITWLLENIGMFEMVAFRDNNEPLALAFTERVLRGIDPDLVAAIPGSRLPSDTAVDEAAEQVMISLADSLPLYIEDLTDAPADLDVSDQPGRREWFTAACEAVVEYRIAQINESIERATARAIDAGFPPGEIDESGLPEGVLDFISSRVADVLGASTAANIEQVKLPIGGTVRVSLVDLDVVAGETGASLGAIREFVACRAVHRSVATVSKTAALLLGLQEWRARLELGLPVEPSGLVDLGRGVRRADQIPNLGAALSSADDSLRLRIFAAARAAGVADVIDDAVGYVAEGLEALDRSRSVLVAGDLPDDDELELLEAVEARRGLRGPVALEAAGGIMTWDHLDPLVHLHG